ncbi:MAG: hypothetical protein ACLSWS_17960, partial [Faecalispora jeddahensis]
SGWKTASFLDSKIGVGTFVISLYDPDHEIGKYVKESGLPAAFNQLDQLSLKIETALNGDSLDSTVQLSIPNLVSALFTQKTSGTLGDTSIPAQPEPGQVVDLSKEESTAAANELGINGIKFLAETMKKDPELTAVLAAFGISSEQLEMMAAYAQG